MPSEPTKRKNAYDNRKLASIPAPLEPDSDSDFNEGSYVYETKPKGKRKTKEAASPERVKSRSRPRRSDVLKGVGPAPRQKKQTRKRSVGHEYNPLRQFFDDSLDLHSAPEEEPVNLDEADDTASETDEDAEPPVLKTMTNFSQQQAGAYSQSSVKPPPESFDPGTENDSTTESEPDMTASFILGKRKEPTSPMSMPTSKRPKSPVEKDNSATESESEPEVPPRADDKSTTESESEFELPPNSSLHPRPGFALAPGQRPLGSFILDRGNGITVPAAINTYLRDYQREGVTFFWERYNEDRGGLLGDDMGLGKTIQVISFLSAIMRKHGDKRDVGRRRSHVATLQNEPDWIKHQRLPPANESWPTCLIVAPSSVVPNWERELHTWGYFEVGVYGGKPSEREQVLKQFKMGRLDVVIASFDMARRNIDQLEELAWSTIIVDEVHRFKNPTSKGTEAFNQFLCKCRFGLTGTAIQNSYNELWTILDWTNPGQLGTLRQWKGYVFQPLTVGQSSKATEEERTKALVVATILRDKILPRFFKRRTKDIIKSQLPTKTDEVVFCPLTSRQITVYKRMLASDDIQRLFNKDKVCDCGSKKRQKDCCYPIDKGVVLKYMSILIKISNHLALILPAPNDSSDQTKRNRELVKIAFPGEAPPKFGTAMLQSDLCGKWIVLDTLLKDWHEEPSNKVLIFTKSIKLLEMLEFHLRANNFGFCKLDGSTKQSDRMPVIDKFNQDPDTFIFLISTLAGGTGLNLTGANKVVIFDPNWNPAHDLQAMDRAYRFGQTRDVSVYRLLGAGSIEELIYARQLYKQQQMAIGYTASVQTRFFQGVQGDASRQGELFGIQNIFRLHEDTLATKMAIERATLIELDWALAHLSGKAKTSSGQKAEEWVYDADNRANKEDADLKGLSALLFDDEIPEISSQSDVQKTLIAIGVEYSHHNDEVLVPSRIEEERSRNALKEYKRQRAAKGRAARQSKASASTREKTPEPVWPPKRRHHKPILSPKSKLASRQMALVELGMISHPADLPAFAQSFGRMSGDEQAELLGKLDRHAQT